MHMVVRPAHTWPIVDRFSLRLPGDWIGLDLSGPNAQHRMVRALDAAQQRDPEIKKHRVAYRQFFDGLFLQARQAGIVFAACTYTVVEDVLPVQASVNVSLIRPDVPMSSADDVARQLLADHGDTDIDLRVVPHSLGRSVRIVYLHELFDPGDPEPAMRTFVVRHHLALGGGLAMLTFASPTFELRNDLEGLFDDIAATFDEAKYRPPDISFEPDTGEG